MSSRVFIVQRPTQRDPVSGAIVPSMDLSPAREWGECLYILRDYENPFADLSATAEAVQTFFRENDFNEEDYLLLVGNPALIGVVSALAADRVACLRMLQWSRHDHAYREVVAQLPEPAAA